MTAFDLRMDLERDIETLINTFQNRTNLRVSDVIVLDVGFDRHKLPRNSNITIETEEAP